MDHADGAPPSASAPRPGPAAAPRRSLRRKLLFAGIVLFGCALIAEAGLRIAQPEFIRFVMASRRTFGYEEWWRRVLRPNVSERYVMRRDDGSPIFDFVVATDGSACAARSPTNRSPSRTRAHRGASWPASAIR